MQSYIVLIIIGAYLGLLLLISHVVSRRHSDNEAFFRANRSSPWWVVAIGMIGTSISGVTFVSVPGMVRESNFYYMQMVFGFFFGYVLIAKVLLPLYYRLNLTSIYTYLDTRLGRKSYKTGASFFLLGKLIGAAARLYIAAVILQNILFNRLGIPFVVNVAVTVLLIWLYTRRSGIKTVIWTDTLQTVVFLIALLLIMVRTVQCINLPTEQLTDLLKHSAQTDMFLFGDGISKYNFWKQFLTGVFIPIVMTGLDQDMMQKNLTINTLKNAQKNMYWYGLAFVPINFLFLTLGALLLLFASQRGIALPPLSDSILPMLATDYLGGAALVFFVMGIVASAFSSADSALTALTTSFAVDMLEVDKMADCRQAETVRRRIHGCMALALVGIILLFNAIGNKSILDTIYTFVSYTYGPLLGMYAFGLLTKRQTNDRLIPYIAMLSPVVCYLLNLISKNCWGYAFGYELLMLNGLITFAGIWMAGCSSTRNKSYHLS